MTRSPRHFLLLAAFAGVLIASTARAQFLPGNIYQIESSINFCERDDNGVPWDYEYIFEVNPIEGTSRVFVEMPREYCSMLNNLVMSPDGKHLRVSSYLWGDILEFDSQGNWTIVLDGFDGVNTTGGMAYDQQGNFYVSNDATTKVLRFPAEGGPPDVLAYRNNNGVILQYPLGLAVGLGGDVYVADNWDNELIRISAEGEVVLIDGTFGLQRDIGAVVVDDLGNVYLIVEGIYPFVPGIYRYDPNDSYSRELFLPCSQSTLPICSTTDMVLSPDRTEIYGDSGWPDIIAINPNDGSYRTAAFAPLGGGGLAVVPLRGDVNGDEDEDLADWDWLVSCMDGPTMSFTGSCDLADMDADGDVDLFDVRFFLWAHSALQD